MLHQPAVKRPRQTATFRGPERSHTPAIRAAATSCLHLHHEQSSLREALLPHQEIQLAKTTTPPLSQTPPTASLQQAAHLLLSPKARVVVMARTSHKRPLPNRRSIPPPVISGRHSPGSGEAISKSRTRCRHHKAGGDPKRHLEKAIKPDPPHLGWISSQHHDRECDASKPKPINSKRNRPQSQPRPTIAMP